MDRDELIEELKKCPPGKITVTRRGKDGEVFYADIERVRTVPAVTIEAIE